MQKIAVIERNFHQLIKITLPNNYAAFHICRNSHLNRIAECKSLYSPYLLSIVQFAAVFFF